MIGSQKLFASLRKYKYLIGTFTSLQMMSREKNSPELVFAWKKNFTGVTFVVSFKLLVLASDVIREEFQVQDLNTDFVET